MDLEILEQNLIDLLDPSIPPEVISDFWDLKEEMGTIPMGISFFPEKGWYVITPNYLESPILKFFPKEEILCAF